MRQERVRCCGVRPWVLRWWALVWLLPGLAWCQPQTPLLPAEVFFRNSDLQDAALSPSGRWLAVKVAGANGRYALGLFDVSGATPPAVLAHFSDIDIGRFHWVTDERLVFDLVDLERGEGDRRYAPGLFSIKRDGTETRQLVQMSRRFVTGLAGPGRQPLDVLHHLLAVPGDGSDDVIVGEWQLDNWGEPVALVPKRLNVVTGRAVTLGRGMPRYATGWLFDSSGLPRLAVVTREGRRQVLWRANPADDSAEAWAELDSGDALATPWTPRFLDAQGSLYVTVPAGPQSESVLKRFDFERRQPQPAALVATPGFDFLGEPVAETAGGRLLGWRVTTDAETTVWLDPRGKALQEEIDGRLPGRVNRLSCRRCGQEGETWLVFSWSDRQPGQFWLWRGQPDAVTTPSLWRLVGAVRKGVEPQAMASVSLERFAARDGRGIPLWITLPAGHQADGKAPAVVLVHGGPWVRGGSWRWDGMAQFLASRGYVVLEPEFRGSTGYGAAHFRAGWRQWGRAMQDDLADALAWAADKKLVDGRRACIAGASYGGYATLMGLVRHPDLYRCGAAWVAVAEPGLLFKSSWQNDVSEEARVYRLPRLLADPEADAALLREISPVVQAARIRAPLLLAYGESDRRVPLEHGRRMRSALQDQGQAPEWVVYDGEGHRWQRTETRLDFARRLEQFLARHLRQP
jgi:acetyl esterase/lipase